MQERHDDRRQRAHRRADQRHEIGDPDPQREQEGVGHAEREHVTSEATAAMRLVTRLPNTHPETERSDRSAMRVVGPRSSSGSALSPVRTMRGPRGAGRS